MLAERIEEMLDEGFSANQIQRALEAEGGHSRAEIQMAMKREKSIESDLDELDEYDAHDQTRVDPEAQKRGD